jgi:hypothetical protein
MSLYANARRRRVCCTLCARCAFQTIEFATQGRKIEIGKRRR